MFLSLLIVTFCVSFAVASIVVLIFTRPIENILKRVIADQISAAWAKYLRFAMFVTGIASGVRIWALEKYITAPQYKDAKVVVLTTDRWVLEIYRAIIETLQGMAWMLLVFFVFALVAFVIVRIFELRQKPEG